MTYLIIPERSHDGSWSAIAPDLPGLLMAGTSREELLANAPDAMRESEFPIDPPGTDPVELIFDQEEPVAITVTVSAA